MFDAAADAAAARNLDCLIDIGTLSCKGDTAGYRAVRLKGFYAGHYRRMPPRMGAERKFLLLLREAVAVKRRFEPDFERERRFMIFMLHVVV